MKNLKHLLFSGLVLMLVFSSCTMEKRVYSSGYHIDWNKSKQNPSAQKLANNYNENKTKQNEILTVEEPKNSINTFENTESMPDEVITASVDHKQIILPSKEKNNLLSSNKLNTSASKPTFKSEFKEGMKLILANEDETKVHYFAITGFITSLLGIFLFGFILGVIAIIFSAIGLTKIKNEPTKWTGKGMAIAGLIIGIVEIIAWLIILALLF